MIFMTMVLALCRKANDRILRIITEPFPQFSLFISSGSLENRATNKSLPVKRAHALPELLSSCLTVPAPPPGHAGINTRVLQRNPQIGVQAAALSEKKSSSWDSEIGGGGDRERRHWNLTAPHNALRIRATRQIQLQI